MILQTRADFLDSKKGEAKSVFVRAGAGAGKTTELVSRVLAVALQFRQRTGRWPRLVVTTFTRKATQELRERLAEKARSLDFELFEYVQNSTSLQITTIHGVLTSLLTEQGHHLGLSPDFQILNNLEHKRLRKTSVRELFQNPLWAKAYLTLRSHFSLNELQAMAHNFWRDRLENPQLKLESTQDLIFQREQLLSELQRELEVLVQELSQQKLSPAWQENFSLWSAVLQSPGELQHKILNSDLWPQNSPRAVKTLSNETLERAKKVFQTVKNLQSPFWTPEFLQKRDDVNRDFLEWAQALGDRVWKKN